MEKIDAQTQLFLEKAHLIHEPDYEVSSIEENRRKLSLLPLPSPIDTLSITDYSISLADRKIPLRIYVPKGKGPFPVHLFMHGGGWVFGSLDSHDAYCRTISLQASVIVVSVDYRLAPEHKYPAAFDDCCEALSWTAKNIEEFGGDASKLMIGGISAGGNLAAAVSLKAKEGRLPTIKAQLLICPVMHHSFDTSSYQRYAEEYYLTKKDMEFFWDQYLEKADDGKEIYASPLLAPNTADLPPTLIVLATFDPLYDEGLAFGKKLESSGTPVTIKTYPTFHGFMSKLSDFEISKKAATDISEFISHAK